ncbi:MAG: putative system TPR-repeat lipoprotein [Verrucomicrobiales bacterium]|jgi:tetratricopeptide (TPR) repeat protein|nr:putative system TPR-repeat lipoprotein [Verrucomicrobiales bacterium]MDB6129171.1 putative system TPR-repeat lipoprotein [Verrucomicrobiales bacterium]
MSRFGNLEVNLPNDENTSASAVTKDEAYYLGEAVKDFEKGEFESALRNYGKVIEYNPKNAQGWVGQVQMLIELDDLDGAANWANHSLSSFASDAQLLSLKAVIVARTGRDIAGALSLSDAAMALAPGNSLVWLARADVMLNNNPSAASFCVSRALEGSPDDWKLRWLAGRIFCYYKRFSQALSFVQEALALNPSNAILWAQAGFLQGKLGLMERARSSVAQALQISPACGLAIETRDTLADPGLLDRMFLFFKRTK